MKSVKIQKNVLVKRSDRNRSRGPPGADRNATMREKIRPFRNMYAVRIT